MDDIITLIIITLVMMYFLFKNNGNDGPKRFK